MNAITCFTDVDALFDTRRGIIHKVAIESGNTNFDWDRNFAQIYKRRNFDYFNQPELGVTQEKYLERYAKRSIDDFADAERAYVLPSKLIRNMFKIIRELEFGVGQMIAVASFNLTVNLYPYEIDGDLLDELDGVIRGAVPFNISLSFVNTPHSELTPSVLNAYQYVFLYDFLVGETYKAYWELYGQARPSTVRFIIPDVLKSDDIPEEMRREEPIETLGKMNVVQGGKITWIPIPKTVFDYKE